MARFGEGAQDAVTARMEQQQDDAAEAALDGVDAGWGTGELPTVSAVEGGEAGWEGDDGFGAGETDLAAGQDLDGDGFPDVPDLTGAGV